MQISRTASKHKNSISGMKIICLILALVPVIALVLITINLVSNSILAIDKIGLKGLFSNEYSGVFSTGKGLYGLLPALGGTVMVVIIAMIIATPVSLALAVLANDFAPRFLGTYLRWMMGILSGIPPIIYALMTVVIFELFIVTKFGGAGLPASELPPHYMLPYDGSSLLGGILLALLIIPFMAPLMDDSIKNVNPTLKEASLALGATRWHTLITVTIPSAFSGIWSAIILGILTGLGDAIIVSFAIGFEAAKLPTPVFDFLERLAPLTSTAAGLVGGFSGLSGNVIQISVASFIGLLLLVIAMLILVVSTYFQLRLKR